MQPEEKIEFAALLEEKILKRKYAVKVELVRGERFVNGVPVLLIRTTFPPERPPDERAI
jgi:hypothetical protein